MRAVLSSSVSPIGRVAPDLRETVVDAHYEAVFRVAYHLAPGPAQAAALTRDAFAALFSMPLGDMPRDLRGALLRFLCRAAARRPGSRDASSPVGGLAPLPRACVVLHHLEGFGPEELAACLGISPAEAMEQLSFGKEALRQSGPAFPP